MPTYILVQSGIPTVVEQFPQIRANRLGVIGRFWEQMQAFDEEFEYQLVVNNVPSYGWLAKILAFSIYNPIVDLQCEWAPSDTYNAQRIIALVKASLPDDDDIVQQWFDGPEVIELLEAGNTFSRMVLAVKCICGFHETDEESRDFAKAVLGISRVAN